MPETRKKRTAIIVHCAQCENAFYATPLRIASGRDKYCSAACYFESKRKEPKDAWELVDQSGGPTSCWPWQGTITRQGYGQFKCNGELWRAHRLIYTLVHGAIADDMMIRHDCDNPPCCNPAHLREGTHDDNMNDKVERHRNATGDRAGARLHPDRLPRGMAHGNAKLTDNAVREIRRLRTEGMTYEQISNQFGVCEATIGNIVTGKIWKHVA
jgi:hypothetical protein